MDFDEDDDLWIEGDRLSSYAAAAAVEAAYGTLAVDLRDVPALSAARKASEVLARRRRRSEAALRGRSAVIARKWVLRAGDEAVWVSPGEPDRRCVILARSPSRTTTTPRWKILADNIGETQIFSTSLRMDLAFLNEGKDLDAREKALMTAERTVAARSRAEQRQALREARDTLGSDVTSPVDWRATVFDDKEIWLASEADFLRGVNCKLLRATLETVSNTAKCTYAEAFDACRALAHGRAACRLPTMSICLPDDVRAMSRVVDRAVDRLQAYSASLAAAASAATRECKVCATVVCKSCQQVGHDGPCAAAASALDENLWRGNWQRCPGCKTVVEKKEVRGRRPSRIRHRRDSSLITSHRRATTCGAGAERSSVTIAARAATVVRWIASGRACSTRPRPSDRSTAPTAPPTTRRRPAPTYRRRIGSSAAPRPARATED